MASLEDGQFQEEPRGSIMASEVKTGRWFLEILGNLLNRNDEDLFYFLKVDFHPPAQEAIREVVDGEKALSLSERSPERAPQ